MNVLIGFLSQLTEKSLALINEPYIYITLLLFLLIAGVIDYKTKKIPNKLTYTVIVFRFILIPFVGITWWEILGAFIGALIILIPAMISMTSMGGDIKMNFIVGLYLGPIAVLCYSMISFGLLSITLIYLFKRKKISILPVAPFFLATHLVVGLLIYIN